jgi:hypothetical protein
MYGSQSSRVNSNQQERRKATPLRELNGGETPSPYPLPRWAGLSGESFSVADMAPKDSRRLQFRRLAGELVSPTRGLEEPDRRGSAKCTHLGLQCRAKRLVCIAEALSPDSPARWGRGKSARWQRDLSLLMRKGFASSCDKIASELRILPENAGVSFSHQSTPSHITSWTQK